MTCGQDEAISIGPLGIRRIMFEDFREKYRPDFRTA